MSKGRIVTIWDGIQYRRVGIDEANRLVEADMAQLCDKAQSDMRDRKFRRDFTGYKTREVRAEKPEVAKVEKKVEPKKPEPKKPEPKKGPAKKKATAKKPTTK